MAQASRKTTILTRRDGQSRLNSSVVSTYLLPLEHLKLYFLFVLNLVNRSSLGPTLLLTCRCTVDRC